MTIRTIVLAAILSASITVCLGSDTQLECDAEIFRTPISSSTDADEADYAFKEGLLGALFCKKPEDHKNTGFIDFNSYWDSRDFSVLTINSLIKLPNDFEYFQFVNYTSPLGDTSQLDDWNDFFTEIHLRRPISKESELVPHLDWNVMWADGGFPSGVGRLGIRWRLHDTPGWLGKFITDSLDLQYAITFHALQSNGDGWQIEHVYRRSFLDGLMYVSGFADHNITEDSSSAWVTEHQIGAKLYRNVYGVAEYRYNSFLAGPLRSGWGFGLQYFVPFN